MDIVIIYVERIKSSSQESQIGSGLKSKVLEEFFVQPQVKYSKPWRRRSHEESLELFDCFRGLKQPPFRTFMCLKYGQRNV